MVMLVKKQTLAPFELHIFELQQMLYFCSSDLCFQFVEAATGRKVLKAPRAKLATRAMKAHCSDVMLM